MSGRRAPVSAAMAAKARAPRTLAGRTVAQRRRVFQKCFLFGEDESDGVEGVFGEELGAAEDDHDEAEGVKHLCDEEGGVGGSGAGGSEERDGDGVAECGEAHEDAAGEAGDGEGDAGAAEFLAGVVGDLLVDVLGAGALEMLLRVLRGGGLARGSGGGERACV